MAGRNDEEVRILVTAKDEASKTLANVGDSMGGLAKKAGGMGSALTTAVGTFAGGAALNLAASGISALTGFVTDGIAGAQEAALGYAQLEAVLKSTGGAAGLTADELAGLSGDLSQAAGMSTFSDDAVLGLENLLLTFTNVKGDIFKQATAIGVDMATAMGTEPQAAAIQLGKALNDPIKGIAALSRVGVTFTDQQKDQIKAMQEAGDMAGAQSVILAELNKEFGGSAKAAAEAAGPMAQFQEQMGELSEEIGAALLPLMQQFFAFLLSPAVQGAITGIVDLLVGAIANVSAFIEELKAGFSEGGMAGLFDAFKARIVEMAPVIADTLKTWATEFIAWIGPLIPPFLAELGKLVGELLTWIVGQLPGIGAQLLEWAKAFADWVMTTGWPLLKAEMIKLGASVDTWMADQAKTLLNNALAWGKGIVDGLLKGVQDNWNRFTTWITNQLKKIPGFDLLFGSGASSGTGGGSGPFAAPMGLAAAGAGVVSGVTVPSFSMVPRRPIGDVPNRGVIVAPPVVIHVDARGSRDPVEVERAGYRGARRALEEAARERVGRRSVQRLRTALDRRARIR